MSTLSTLSDNIVVDIDFRKNTLLDQSGNGNDAVNTGCAWVNTRLGRGVSVRDTNIITVPHSAEQLFTEMTVIVFLDKWRRHEAGTNIRFYQKSLGGGDRIGFYSASTNIVLGIAAVDSNLSYVPTEDVYMMAFRLVGGEKPDFFVNGEFKGQGGAVIATIPQPTASTTLFGLGIANGDQYACHYPGTRAVVLNSADITDKQMSQIYDEHMQQRGVLENPRRNFVYPQLVSFGDFTQDQVWTKGTGWTIAGFKASLDGSQLGASSVDQPVLEIGSEYTIEYEISDRSAGTLRAMAGTTGGTQNSADGIYTEFLTCAGNTNFKLQGNVDFIGSVDWVTVSKGGKLIFKHDMNDVYPTVNDVTDGPLANSEFTCKNGTFRILDGTTKTLQRGGGGEAYISSTQAYGTWVFELELTSTSLYGLQYMADNLSPTVGDWIGYRLRNAGNGAQFINVYPSQATLFQSSDLLADDTVYTMAITRSLTGETHLYVKGGAFSSFTLMPAASGSNPFTDTTHTTSKYMMYNSVGGANDKHRILGIHQEVLTLAKLKEIY